jgi:hypothetical protein
MSEQAIEAAGWCGTMLCTAGIAVQRVVVIVRWASAGTAVTEAGIGSTAPGSAGT